jgi:DNA-binding transcriptional LysR family regulator
MPDLSLKFADLAPRQRYKLLCGLVVPRPIALVSTLSPSGVVNAAPYSFFNAFSENPALIVLGLQHNDDGTPKDTTRNIHVSGEFVVNLVDEGVDLAVRAGVLRDSSLISRRVNGLEAWLFASRAYLDARGTPTSVEQLAEHDCVLFRPKRGRAEWELTSPAGTTRKLRIA